MVVTWRGGVRRYERRSVLLHTKDGGSFRGVLAHAYRDCMVLTNVTTWSGTDPVPLGGEVVVGCENISFFQTVTRDDDARDG